MKRFVSLKGVVGASKSDIAEVVGPAKAEIVARYLQAEQPK
jgi:hypothetical protein